MSVDVSFLKEARQECGFRYQKDLAEAAGVAAPTVSRAERTGSTSQPTAEKLQAVLDEPIGPYMGPRVQGYEDEERPELPVLESEGCLERFEGSDCPTGPRTCRACWQVLREEVDSGDRPFGRAACRLEHGWELDGGMMMYRSASGLVPASQVEIQP